MKAVKLERFDKNFSDELNQLFLVISREGFGLTLVGGAVRDYLIDGTISKDLDFEIRHKFEFSNKQWLSKISRLGKRLSEIYNYDVEELKFSILRIRVDGHEVELSSARTEQFDSSLKVLGHSDFTAHFQSNLSYEESFKRRDFTINAIGIKFGVTGASDEFELIDPFSGYEDLQKKTLRPVGENFYNDPVRYIRALRFKVLLGLSFSDDLKSEIVYFELEKLSVHYFLQEGRKIGLVSLIKEMDFTVRKFAVKLPHWASLLISCPLSNDLQVSDLDELLFECCSFLGPIEVMELGRAFSLKKSLSQSMISIVDCSKIDREKLKVQCENSEHTIINDSEDLEKLSKLVGVAHLFSDKILQRIPADLIVVMNSELRGAKEFEQLKVTVNHKLRSRLGIYCHLRNNQ
ncbi:CCA tRNA nucleotidyltransferase [Halobacteriovorax sp. HLS]|uniref:CCA tRNA nucleotidyltransferase n=1 Tax=Halobacteriovorax sp. HLS TaxID=2234000 RepID=UPI000FD84837|nr:CCA tRNA nucleotidyltransferase [Halobacteriovorax sp. HLS]